MPATKRVGDDVIRVYFATRDREGRTRPTFVDVRGDEPSEVLYVHDRPLLEQNVTCIRPSRRDDAIARPGVLAEGGTYRMWYSYRGSVDFRTDKRHAYRIGYAQSDDGVRWERMDEEVGIDRSESGWDSHMIEYAFIYDHAGKKFMLYNGDEFGETGFGYAVLEEE
jgi:predicted GH43/DUF377 family glycosyl hydrolase